MPNKYDPIVNSSPPPTRQTTPVSFRKFPPLKRVGSSELDAKSSPEPGANSNTDSLTSALVDHYSSKTSDAASGKGLPGAGENANPKSGASLEWLELAIHHNTKSLIDIIHKLNPPIQNFYQTFKTSTQGILAEAENNETALKGLKNEKMRAKAAQNMRFTSRKLKNYAAHAGAVVDDEGESSAGKEGFVNLPGSLTVKGLFSGVKLVSEAIKDDLAEYSPEKLGKAKRWNPQMSLGYYKVTDMEKFIEGIKTAYLQTETQIGLHPYIEKRIRQYVKNMNFILPKMAGIAGLHAEVQALNYIVSQPYDENATLSGRVAKTYIYTQRLVGKIKGDFEACNNCSGILNGLENIMTGRVDDHVMLNRRKSF